MNILFSLANPTRFRRVMRPVLWIATVAGMALAAYGVYLALCASPPDYLQRDSVRIMYVHVPAAWISLLCYAVMSAAALSCLVWRHTLGGLYVRAAAPMGAAFTLICLITGALWGQPTWGAWWVWDARLTSVLILFFIYAGIMALSTAFDDEEKSLRAACWLTLIGVINLPIIKFSVTWWNTLHQPPSIGSLARLANPTIDPAMLTPLLVMGGAYLCAFIALSIARLDNEMTTRRLENKR